MEIDIQAALARELGTRCRATPRIGQHGRVVLMRAAGHAAQYATGFGDQIGYFHPMHRAVEVDGEQGDTLQRDAVAPPFPHFAKDAPIVTTWPS